MLKTVIKPDVILFVNIVPDGERRLTAYEQQENDDVINRIIRRLSLVGKGETGQ